MTNSKQKYIFSFKISIEGFKTVFRFQSGCNKKKKKNYYRVRLQINKNFIKFL